MKERERIEVNKEFLFLSEFTILLSLMVGKLRNIKLTSTTAGPSTNREIERERGKIRETFLKNSN